MVRKPASVWRISVMLDMHCCNTQRWRPLSVAQHRRARRIPKIVTLLFASLRIITTSPSVVGIGPVIQNASEATP